MIDSRQMLDRRGRVLRIGLDFVDLPQEAGGSAVEIRSLRRWLDSWAGVGASVRGMTHQGYDLQLTRYDEQGWRATFYPDGMEHSATSAVGSAWERTPWLAVRRAARAALSARANAQQPPAIRPMQLQVGDRFTAEEGDWGSQIDPSLDYS